MFDYVEGKQEWFGYGLPLEGEDASVPRAVERIDREVVTCAPSERIGAVRERVRAAGQDACIVVNERRVVLGLLGPSELAGAAETPAEDVMEPGPSTFRPNVPLAELREFFQKRKFDSTPITTPDGVLLGLLRRDAL